VHRSHDDSERSRTVRQTGQIAVSNVLLDLTPQFGWRGRQVLRDLARPCREAGPVILELGVIGAEHDRPFDQPSLTPKVCLSIRLYDRTGFDLCSQRSDALVEHGTCVQYKVQHGVANPEVERATGYDPTGTCASPHLGGDQIDLWRDIDSKVETESSNEAVG
jgi:hypothetical protein